MAVSMLRRFSLYGFLKNQQYYAPFIILAFREKGLTFFTIGLLVGFRELAVNVLEVPTGVVADLSGRRRSMVFSFLAYIVSFVVFGTFLSWGARLDPAAASDGALGQVAQVWPLFAAMVLFAIGEAFRTGTHKAMILDWLRLEGREAEKTQTYGLTRSWSKAGSAVAVVIATALLLLLRRGSQPQYGLVFFFCIVPYALGIVNFLGYPHELDGRPEHAPTLRNMWGQLAAAFRQVFGHRRLRRVFTESMSYQGVHKVATSYMQPVARQMAMTLPLAALLCEADRTTVVAGAVYLVLALVSVFGSLKSAAVARRFGGEQRAARALWLCTLLAYIPVAVALGCQLFWLAAVALVVLSVLFNFWRPITITRIDNETDARMGATLLSIESQGQALVAMVLAPAVGFLVDHLAATPEQPALWVVGIVGVGVALLGTLTPTLSAADTSDSGRNAGGSV